MGCLLRSPEVHAACDDALPRRPCHAFYGGGREYAVSLSERKWPFPHRLWAGGVSGGLIQSSRPRVSTDRRR